MSTLNEEAQRSFSHYLGVSEFDYSGSTLITLLLRLGTLIMLDDSKYVDFGVQPSSAGAGDKVSFIELPLPSLRRHKSQRVY